MVILVSMLKSILKRSKEIEDEIIAWRRDFHMYPELGFQEKRTSRIVAEKLRDWGFEVITGIAETGVVGLLRGSSDERTVALRADMDALPIQEENDVPYRSRVPGVMHACGHDAHTAMLLGAARILSEIKDDLNGCVKLIFQPAEEGVGGAKRMVDEGVLKDPDVDAIFGIHVWSILQSGIIGVREGPILAATGRIEIEVEGAGGHGASPHLTVDPIVAAASIILNLQTVISRNLDPIESGVVSICSVHSGTTYNVIPPRAKLIGTYRALTFEVRNLIKKRIKEIAENTCIALGAKCKVDLIDGVPPTINHPEATKLARETAIELVGSEKVIEPKPSMGGEDFAYYLEQVPGAFLELGTGNPEKGTDKPHHNPKFNVDEEVLYIGSAIYASLAYQFLAKGLPANQ